MSLEVWYIYQPSSIQRLVAKRRLAVPRRGFYVIVPIEYRQAGAPPPDWYIDDLVEFSGRQYYVGLLSAASLHGAAHQQLQEFQIVSDKQLRPVEAGRGRIRFFKKTRMDSTPTMDMKTETGFMHVSTPESTALDLLRHLNTVGHIGHVATVLTELAEKMNSERIVEAAKLDGNLPNAQRLGYPLDLSGARDMGTALANTYQREVRGRSMIPRAHITSWRAIAPRSTDAQVEQDLVISRALVDLYSDDLLAQKLAFRGGTALQKIHSDPPIAYAVVPNLDIRFPVRLTYAPGLPPLWAGTSTSHCIKGIGCYQRGVS